MIRLPVLCPRCHTDQVMKGGKTKGHIWNTTLVCMIRTPSVMTRCFADGQAETTTQGGLRTQPHSPQPSRLWYS